MRHKDEAEIIIQKKADAGDPAYATAYAILQLTQAVERCAFALKQIGTGGDTPGALEFIGMQLRDGVRIIPENE